MKKFEKEFLIYTNNFGNKKSENLIALKNAIYNAIKTNENLYISIKISKTKNNQCIDFEVSKNTYVDFDSIIKHISTLTTIKKSSVYEDQDSLSSVFSEEELSDLEFVQTLKKIYLNDEDEIIEVSSDDGDDENFISPTLHHYNIYFESKYFSITIPKSFII